MKKSKNSAFLAIYAHGYTLSLHSRLLSLHTSEKISHSTSSPECPPSPSAAPWLHQDFEFITPWISSTSFQEQTLPLLPKPWHIHHIHGHWQWLPFSVPRSFNLYSPNSPQQSSFSHKSQHTNTEITFSTFWRIPAMLSQVPHGLRHFIKDTAPGLLRGQKWFFQLTWSTLLKLPPSPHLHTVTGMFQLSGYDCFTYRLWPLEDKHHVLVFTARS